MKDRLDELRQRAQEFREAGDSEATGANPFDNDPDDPVWVGVVTTQPEAVLFEEEPVIENFLSEAQRIRDDITELETEVRLTLSPGLKATNNRKIENY